MAELVNRASDLRRRWFPSAEDEQRQLEQQQQEQALEAEKIEEFLNCGYMANFRELLRNTRKGYNPQPGEKEDMVYRCGLRDGIEAVENILDNLQMRLIRGKHERRQAG